MKKELEIIQNPNFVGELPEITALELEKILKDDLLQVVEVIKKHTLKGKKEIAMLPVIHARQLGLDSNFFVWYYKGDWRVIFNPKVVLSKKCTPKVISEKSYSHLKDEPGFKPNEFATLRFDNALCIYDKVVGKKLVRASKKFKFYDSVSFQAMADISKGLNITRFEMLER